MFKNKTVEYTYLEYKTLRVNKIKIPSEIVKSTNMSVSEVSRSLRTLKDKKLVICLNEDKRVGRVYTLTEKGKEVLKYIE